MKKRKLPWSLAIAVLALLVSFWTLWQAHLRPAEIAVLPGESIALGYMLDEQYLVVVVPVVISNNGSQTGIVHGMGLALSDPTMTEGGTLYMRWFGQVNYNPDMILTRNDRAIPIPIYGRSSVIRYIMFLGDGSFAKWIPEPRSYHLDLVAWTKTSLTPDLRVSFQATFRQEDCEALANFIADKRGLLHWMPSGRLGRWDSKILSITEVREIQSIAE